MERTGIIYKWTNKINNKSYIGQTIYPEKRYNQHINAKDDCSFHKALRKYGVENFTYEVLTDTAPEFILDELEIYYINYYDTYKNGYNLTLGGEGRRGFTITEETRRKLSESHKGQISHNKGKTASEETRRKLSESHKGQIITKEQKIKISEKLKGRPSPNKGKHHSEETRKRISEAGIGRYFSLESRLKKSNSMKGKYHTEETKNKISERNKGKTSAIKGKRKVWNDELDHTKGYHYE